MADDPAWLSGFIVFSLANRIDADGYGDAFDTAGQVIGNQFQ